MTAPRHPAQPRHTRLEDRREVEHFGKELHRAELAFLYEVYPAEEYQARSDAYDRAIAEVAFAAKVYAVGRRRASCEYGQRHYAKSKSGAAQSKQGTP